MNKDVRVIRRSLSVVILATLSFAPCAFIAPASLAQTEAVGESADREWRFIEKLEQDGMADLVLRQLEQFAEKFADDPRAPVALLRAAQGQAELGNPTHATELYEALLERHPSSPQAPEAALARADLLAQQGRWADAVEAYRSLLSAYPASERVEAARLGLGEALMSTGREDEARRVFSGLIGGRAAESIAARARFDLGLLDVRAGADSLAIERFDSVHERHPGEPVAAFALMRAAELLIDREAPDAARERFEKVLAEYDQPVLKSRARLGLASLVEAEDPGRARDLYKVVVEEGATPADLERAFLGLARSALSAGDADLARRAAEGYLERFGDAAAGAPTAQLTRARALFAMDAVQGRSALEDVARSPDRDVAYEAASLLANEDLGSGDLDSAARWWRHAESVAADAARRGRALLEQARLMRRAERFALARDLALAAESAVADEDRESAARAALLAMEAAQDEGDHRAAAEIALRLAQEYPLTESAPRARAQLKLLARLGSFDAHRAARSLAELARQPFDDGFERLLRVGRVEREELGDFEAARTSFAQARDRAQAPAQRGRAGIELAITAQSEAMLLGLQGRSKEAQRRLREARSVLAEVAATDGAEAESREAFSRLLGLELADAARPDAPWLFDTDAAPLLGAVGAAEGVDLGSPALLRVRERIRRRLAEAGETISADERAWLVYREAELADDAVVDRAARVRAEIERGEASEPRLLALRHCLGQLALRAGENASAARELAVVLERAGDTELGFAARYGLAEAHRAEKRYVQAAELYIEFSSAYPSTQRGQRALLLAGDCALLSGRSDDAVTRYRQLLERYPDTVYVDDALYRLGTALHRAGKIEAARDALMRLVEDENKSEYRGRALARLARIERSGGDPERAVEALRRLIEVDPERAAEERAWTELARIELEQGDAGRALEDLDAAAARGDLDAEALALRVRALALLERADAASAALEQLSVAHVDRIDLITEARNDVAECLARAGSDERAAALFRDAAAEARTDEQRARAAYGEALIAAKAGRWADARALFERAAELDGGHWSAEALFKLGQLYDREGDHKASQAAYARIAEEFPDHERAPMALRGEARAWRQMGRFDEALARYHRILERYPEAPGGEEVLGHIAYCHHEMKQYELAIASYRRVMPLLDEEGQAYAQFWIADSLAQLGRSEEAATEFLRIPYLHPQMGQLAVTAQLKAGEAYERAGDAAAARTLYERVLQQHGPQSQWGAEAKRRLDRMEPETRDQP